MSSQGVGFVELEGGTASLAECHASRFVTDLMLTLTCEAPRQDRGMYGRAEYR